MLLKSVVNSLSDKAHATMDEAVEKAPHGLIPSLVYCSPFEQTARSDAQRYRECNFDEVLDRRDVPLQKFCVPAETAK